jgi:hypothetical protein
MRERDDSPAHTRYVLEKSLITEQLRVAKSIINVIAPDDTERLKSWKRTVRELRKRLKELDKQQPPD